MSIWQKLCRWFEGEDAPSSVYLERRINKNGEYYFAIEGLNHETMMTSETYSSKHACDRARANIHALMRPGYATFTTAPGAE